jgi:hypothetical protein
MMTSEELSVFRQKVGKYCLEIHQSNTQSLLQTFQTFEAVNPTVSAKLFPFVRFIIDRADTVFVLAGMDKIWDAEMVQRAMNEAFMKLMYTLVPGDMEVIEQRLKEYWEIMHMHDAKRHSEKCKLLIKAGVVGKNFQSMVLTEEQEAEILADPIWGMKSQRDQLKTRWGYTEMLKDVMKRLGVENVPSFDFFGYYYKMSSHIVHADERGLRVIDERRQRHPLWLKVTNIANFTKLLRVNNEMLFWVRFVADTRLGIKKEEPPIWGTFQLHEATIRQYHSVIAAELDHYASRV